MDVAQGWQPTPWGDGWALYRGPVVASVYRQGERWRSTATKRKHRSRREAMEATEVAIKGEQ